MTCRKAYAQRHRIGEYCVRCRFKHLYYQYPYDKIGSIARRFIMHIVHLLAYVGLEIWLMKVMGKRETTGRVNRLYAAMLEFHIGSIWCPFVLLRVCHRNVRLQNVQSICANSYGIMFCVCRKCALLSAASRNMHFHHTHHDSWHC